MIKVWRVQDYATRVELGEMEFERETEKTYYNKSGRRTNKHSSYENYFTTKEAAQAFMRERYDTKVLEAEDRLKYAQAHLEATKKRRDEFLKSMENKQ